MNIIFKFCGAHGVNLLRDLEIKVTPPNQFNDPFEFTPRFFCSDPELYAIRTFAKPEAAMKLFETLVSYGKYSGTFTSFYENFPRTIKRLATSMKDILSVSLAISQKGLLDFYSQDLGITCASSERDSILMWGHYCVKEAGLVIGFNRDHEAFQSEGKFIPVIYSTDRVPYDACWEKGSVDYEQFRHDIIFTKNAVWAYEKELRMVTFLSSLRSKTMPNGTTGYFLAFPPDAVRNVTLSARASVDFISRVRSILAVPHFSHVKLERAVLHERNFTLSFEPVV